MDTTAKRECLADANTMSMAQRLALAAAEAPILRNASEKTLARRVALVDKDGNVTGYTSGREVLKGLARVQDLEHAVDVRERPKEVVCSFCGRSVRVARTGGGAPPGICNDGCGRRCATPGCDRQTGLHTAKAAARKGARATCRSCAKRKSMGARTPADRSESARRRESAKSPHQRAAGARARAAAMTPEERSQAARRAWVTRRAAADMRHQ